jgi:hypothetical protein
MSMTYVKSFVILSVILVLSSVAQSQTAGCRLMESWVRHNPFHASSNELVEQFPLVLNEMPITKVFRHDESGLDVTVGVEVFKGISKGVPTRIRVALLFGSRPEQLFGADIDASEAVSVYDNHWRLLSVNRTIARGDRLYTFTFSCERPVKKRSH